MLRRVAQSLVDTYILPVRFGLNIRPHCVMDRKGALVVPEGLTLLSMVSAGDDKVSSLEEESEGDAASPRVRLTQARLLDGSLQHQGADDSGVPEDLGSLMVNDAFDMLMRKVRSKAPPLV
jgi:hypothetical protein